MKTYLLVLLLAVATGARAEPLTPRGGHPRLFFTAARIEALKARIGREPPTARAWAALHARADEALRKHRAGDASVGDLALAYRMTGDTRYAALVRAFLLRDIQKPNWGEPDLLRRNPPWHAGLGLARSLYTAAVAFDSIHDYLAPQDRRTIADGIVRLGIQPTLDDWVLGATRIHALDTMGHNWWSACVFTAGVGAIAVLDEEPRAQGWLQRISEASVEWFDYAGSLIENKPATFDPAGGFYESVNYASFALAEYLRFRLAWANAFTNPPPDIPMLAKIGAFFLNVAYPNSGTMMTLDFGDGSLHADGSRPLALLWNLGYRTPAAAWYLKATQTMTYREGLDRTTPFGLVYFPSEAQLADAPATPTLAPSKLYPEMGWAMLRSSWDKDATLLGVKSGYTWNHSHADAGSFILFHGGQDLLIDSGNCSYARPEYDRYYRQSAAHNVVLFNGEAENPEDTYFGSKFPGSVSHLIDTGDLKYVLADATGPTSHVFDRNYRHFLWIGDVILVIDDVEAFKPGQFDWLLHTATPAVRKGLDLHVESGGASVLVRPLFPSMFPDAGLPTDYPERMRLVEKTGLADHDADQKVPYYSFEPAEQRRHTTFVNAITLVTPANRAQLPEIQRLVDSKNVIGVRIRQQGITTDVYLNLLAEGRIRHRNANATLGGWDTDAYLLALSYRDQGQGTRDQGSGTKDQGGRTRDEAQTPERVFIADGSYLRRNGTVVLDSLSKVFATWTQSPAGALDVVLQGQPVMNVRLHTGPKPTEVRVNGRVESVPYDSASQAVEIRPTPVTAH